MTMEQNIISTFIAKQYIKSDSEELDKWLVFLAIENGDEELAKKLMDKE